MSKHTPGWKFMRGGMMVSKDESIIIGTFHADRNLRDADEIRALVISAPETAAERDALKEAKRELLEALKECEEALGFLQERNGMRVNPPTLENARAALAKHSKGE